MKFFKNFDFNFFGRKPKVATVEEVVYNTFQKEKSYKNILYSNGIATIIFKDGDVLSSACNQTKFEYIRHLTEKDQFYKAFNDLTREVIEPQQSDILDNLAKNREEVLELLGKKFETKTDGFYIKGINLVLPDIVLNTFVELTKANNTEELQALEMFWYWTALNPIESSRNDLFKFIKNNDVKLTANGLLELYRRVVKVAADTTFPEFVSNSWAKTKSYKKSPKNYFVYHGVDTTDYKLAHADKISTPGFQAENNVVDGNLDRLYHGLKDSEDNLYTDKYTKKKEIRIGQIYREDEDKVDLDNSRDCSSGLHVGSQSFMFNSFGDTGVLALVNPMYVRSVPRSETNKMRVSEMMIVAKLDLDDYKKSVDDGVMLDYSEIYANQSVEELAEMIDNNKFDKLVCQDNVTPISITDIKSVISNLQSKIVTF